MAEKPTQTQSNNRKSGARHSTKDQQHLDQAAAHLASAGAAFPAAGNGENAEAKALRLLAAAKAVPEGFDPGQYAVSEAWDAATAGGVIPQLAALLSSEMYQQDADGVKLIQACIVALSKFITGEAADMADALAEDATEDAIVPDVVTSQMALGGNALKTISTTDDELRVGNHIVLFGGRDLSGYGFVGAGSPTYKNKDGSTGEFFDKTVKVDSDYTAIGRLPVDWEHGATDEADRDDVLGYVDWKTARRDDKGVFVERVLNRRNQYVKWVEELINAGLIGTSSEAVSKHIKRLDNGAIVSWPLMRDTLTVSPAEPRMLSENVVAALKALGVTPIPQVTTSGQDLLPDGGKSVPAPTPPTAPDGAKGIAGPAPAAQPTATNTKEFDMTDEELKALRDEQAAIKAQNVELIELNKKTLASLTAPALNTVPAQGQIVQTSDLKPFKYLTEQVVAVRDRQNGQASEQQNNRLEAVKAYNMKAAGASENIGSEAGVLVQTDFAADIFQRTYTTGALSGRCAVQEIGAGFSGIKIPAVDEQSRANGSRFGGVQAYWMAEAQSATKSKPTWRLVILELKKLFAVTYATDELLQDVAGYDSFLMRTLPQEINFKIDDAVINGPGGGQPLGILNAAATVSVAKEVGQAAKTIVPLNIFKMWAAMWAGGQGAAIMQGNGQSQSGAVWFVNQDVMPQLFALALPVGTGGLPVFMPPNGLSGSPYAMLLGRPVIPVEQCQTLGTVGDIILADLSQYVMARKGGINAQQSLHLNFLTDEMTYRWTLRTDLQPLWNTSLTPYNGSNKQSPYITLATR